MDDSNICHQVTGLQAEHQLLSVTHPIPDFAFSQAYNLCGIWQWFAASTFRIQFQK